MSFLNKILKGLKSVFTALFNAAKKAYEKLPADAQQALQNGVGLTDLINTMTENTSTEIRAAIALRFPNLDEVQLENNLFRLIHLWGIDNINNIDEAINAIKQKLSTLEGKEWAVASHVAASTLAVAFSKDPGVKVGVLVSLIEWVYQHFFRR